MISDNGLQRGDERPRPSRRDPASVRVTREGAAEPQEVLQQPTNCPQPLWQLRGRFLAVLIALRSEHKFLAATRNPENTNGPGCSEKGEGSWTAVVDVSRPQQQMLGTHGLRHFPRGTSPIHLVTSFNRSSKCVCLSRTSAAGQAMMLRTDKDAALNCPWPQLCRPSTTLTRYLNIVLKSAVEEVSL